MKLALIKHLKTLSDDRMKIAFDAMMAAQASANEEGKSSAGDKYETARAMGQIERDMHARQYENIKQERAILDKLNIDLVFARVGLGALVKTSIGTFFISVSVGAVQIENQKILCVSAQSPIGALLVGKNLGDVFSFQEKKVTIEHIC